ncbi:Mo-dependent nitrogenase C-terminal domain-containing protein [Anabaena sphaerica FACHB-251]|uniref:Mo-dependent nitrogenase C-terminal domain-containing protein n=1 Tax=Anabaena sphaerica FACHB-251 TaxID=2692883 RepID=A0A926WF14_9NOST|nr:Mo-dependent nitrogenase C-terminal domain-containing protein [Anabaena sphaerica]MBD2293283.1 Mo-dependent nitrogenase C-terminal domain-containing protein [Anabaena sphaerica FACHB-251]
MKVFESTTKKIFFSSWVSLHQAESKKADVTQLQASHSHFGWGFLRPLRQWLDNLKVGDRLLAHRLCKFIPAQCPFERDVKLFGKTLFHIPPMCKLNPLYEEVVGLRFRAMCYLADECGEDISQYC